MPASKQDKISIIRTYLDWVERNEVINPSAAYTLDRYAEEVLTECDCAIGHGPGHQSTSYCIRTPSPHTEHYSDMGHDWHDKDISQQTHTRRRDGKVFRLAFTDW